MNFKIAVVGATGTVGREMLNCLSERQFPAKDVIALASPKSKGKKVSFGDKILIVQSLEEYDFGDTDIALFSAGSEVSSIYGSKAAEQGCVVIDNASFFRMDPKVPLIVPEVNIHELAKYRTRNIIANPNCCAIPLAVVLKPLHDQVQIKRVVVSTYQSVSGAGKEAMDELYKQTKGKYMNEHIPNRTFTKQIAFNLIPQIDSFIDGGETKEEWKLRNETKKILGSEIEISATCVRVPVFVGHSESINIEFNEEFSPELAKKVLEAAEGITVVDNVEEESSFITPIECVGDDSVFVSRIRQDPSKLTAINMWVVSDNLRKGAALNAVQIAEELVKKYLRVLI